MVGGPACQPRPARRWIPDAPATSSEGCLLSRERASTAATPRGLRVLEDKSPPHQVFVVVEGGVGQVDVAFGVHEQPRPVLLEHFVAAARLRIQAHRVGQPGAAAPLHADAQPTRIGGHAVLRHQLADFLRRLFRQMDHRPDLCPAAAPQSCAAAVCVAGESTPFFFFQSPMAALMASSASTEQWIFTGGRLSSRTISVFLMASAWSTVLPFTHSVASDELAIAEPQPKVLNFASSITCVCGLIFICSFITSPHSGAPTRPVPTFGSSFGRLPTLRGWL